MKQTSRLHKLTAFLCLVLYLFTSTGFAQSTKKSRPSTSEFIPGTIVVKVKEGVGQFEKQKGHIAFGISSLDKKVQEFSVNKLEKRFKHKPIKRNSGLPDLSRIYRIEFPASYDVHQVAREFSKDPNIEYAEAIPIAHAADVPDDPMYSSQQHLPQIMASEAWDIHKGEDGEEVIIAIIDTGVDWLHPDLTENCWQNLGEDADGDGVTLEFNNGVWERDPDDLNGIDDDGNGFIDDMIGWDFYEALTIGDGSNPDPQGDDGHGTHCAGIAAGVTNNGIGISSISHNVAYMPVQVASGGLEYYWDGIIYAAENGADIISNSWGISAYSEVGRETIEYAVGLGSIVVVAAHNYNSDTKFYPAAYPGAIAVAAVNPDDTRADFSNYGAWIDIAAPGTSILSTRPNNSYLSGNGTSYSTPMVAGLFALLKSYNPAWTNGQLIQQIIGTADNIDALNLGYEKALGSGRINAYQTLVDENVEVPQELRLEILNFVLEDEDGDGALEAGETVSVSLSLRNYSAFVSDDNASITLSSIDPDIIVTSSSVNTAIPADDYFEVINAFEFTIAEDAETHIADLLFEINSDIPVVFGSETETSVIIAPSGIFVWEGDSNEPNYSGTFIRDFLQEQGYPVWFSNTYPESFTGYDAVFLSFGTAFGGTLFSGSMSDVVIDYLQDGGSVYLEGGESLGYEQQANSTLLNLFGLSTAEDGSEWNAIDGLTGNTGTLTEGISFNSSSQSLNYWIDKFQPLNDADIAFTESDYGTVAAQYSGSFGQKTFCFSYALSELHDEGSNTRNELMKRILEFFEVPCALEADAGDCATVYMGYEPAECTDLTATAMHGFAPYSYLWSTGETSESISVCPTTSTTFSVSVTDAEGCVSIDEVDVNVIDVRCGKKMNKVEICHIPQGNPENKQSKCVNANDVAYHLAHGDFLGNCDIGPCDGFYTVSDIDKTLINSIAEIIKEDWKIYPNPATDQLTLEISLERQQTVVINIFDFSGRMISEKTISLDAGLHKIDYDIKKYPSGLKYLRIQTEENVKTLKWIKVD